MPLVLSYGQASTFVSQLGLFELFLLEELLHIKWAREQNAEYSTAAETFICDTGQPGSLLLLTVYYLWRVKLLTEEMKEFHFH